MIFLILVLFNFVFAETIVPFPGLVKPDQIQVNDRYIYVGEGFKIKIFSLSDFKLKKTFGRRGEGPKEFKGFILVYVQPDYIFITSTHKVSYFTLDGEFIKEKKIKKKQLIS